MPDADSLGRAVAAPVTAASRCHPSPLLQWTATRVRSADLNANAGYSLQQIGTSLAGHPFNGSVRHGQCVRIFTGAALPEGADLVVVQENVTYEDAGQVSFIPHTSKDTNVRAIGNDIAAGQVLVDTGETINPFLLGHLAAAGVTELPVFTKVRVGIFSSGDELRDPGTPVDQLRYCDIYDANRITLLQLLKGLPVDCVDLGCLPDDPEAVSSALSSAALTCDVLLTSGVFLLATQTSSWSKFSVKVNCNSGV